MKISTVFAALVLSSVALSGMHDYTVQDYQNAGSLIVVYQQGKEDEARKKIEESNLRIVGSMVDGYECEWDGEFTFFLLAMLKRLGGEEGVRYVSPNFKVNVKPLKNKTENPPEVAKKDVKKNVWYLVERYTGKRYAGIAYNDGSYVFHSIRTDEEGIFQSFQIHNSDVKSVHGPLF